MVNLFELLPIGKRVPFSMPGDEIHGIVTKTGKKVLRYIPADGAHKLTSVMHKTGTVVHYITSKK